jgi:hypothetical protein
MRRETRRNATNPLSTLELSKLSRTIHTHPGTENLDLVRVHGWV